MTLTLLLDTHTFLWFVNDSPELSQTAINLLESENELLVSIASLWEIAIKVNLKKLILATNYQQFIPQQLALNQIGILPISLNHLSIYTDLPLYHRDPFDRLIIAQAMSEKLSIISIDQKLDLYEIDRQW
ncbi:type II toxin-antitoxin system VapC family toxin [Aphanothece sacrum]|uniref:Twitching motility protein PilT n=1 Tax=Aphanothece sacrum FPU1 TaxID=1920663 RepID=A0A401ILK9_APHSA|nr:type II toxin-antitoxin system VapC family toxin [Aphanothece sacrum]GBF82116.1 twitching motility protein PilT [Aphanothece sacrum FPU1]GBF85050.1 twitching motility protein [Aphanothece sacrum FPU3]